MRLINSSTLELVDFPYDDNRPDFAILSHTWGPPEDEVLFADMMAGLDIARKKKSFDKVYRTCQLAKSQNLAYCWIDTCSIDKSSSSELQEAINSMFRWYGDAKECYVYLADVPETIHEVHLPDSKFRTSRWFTRGWTLQELLAPAADKLYFYNSRWEFLSSKGSIAALLQDITGIKDTCFNHHWAIQLASIAERMSWASKRHTSRIEDVAYSLLGIFDINMPMLYGEGSKAFVRLQEEIIRSSHDLTIFSWRDHTANLINDYDLLAAHPSAFTKCGNFQQTFLTGADSPIHMTSWGLCIQARLMRISRNAYAMPIGTREITVPNAGLYSVHHPVHLAVIIMETDSRRNQYRRINAGQLLGINGVDWPISKTIYFPQKEQWGLEMGDFLLPKTPHSIVPYFGTSVLVLDAGEHDCIEGSCLSHRESTVAPLSLSDTDTREWVQVGWRVIWRCWDRHKFGRALIMLPAGRTIVVLFRMAISPEVDRSGLEPVEVASASLSAPIKKLADFAAYEVNALAKQGHGEPNPSQWHSSLQTVRLGDGLAINVFGLQSEVPSQGQSHSSWGDPVFVIRLSKVG
jgi:hypothetical protein